MSIFEIGHVRFLLHDRMFQNVREFKGVGIRGSQGSFRFEDPLSESHKENFSQDFNKINSFNSYNTYIAIYIYIYIYTYTSKLNLIVFYRQRESQRFSNSLNCSYYLSLSIYLSILHTLSKKTIRFGLEVYIYIYIYIYTYIQLYMYYMN